MINKKRIYTPEQKLRNAIRDKRYRIAHLEHTKQVKREYYLKNREKYLAKFKEYGVINRDKIIARKRSNYQKDPEHQKKINKKYVIKNREKVNRRKLAYHHHREKTSLNYKLANRLRNRLRMAIKDNAKAGSAVCDLGCTIEELKKYLEAQFSQGMTWQNYGWLWHIDHIKPLCLFNLSNREQFLVACNYTNLQPLWKIDNLKKAGKY